MQRSRVCLLNFCLIFFFPFRSPPPFFVVNGGMFLYLVCLFVYSYMIHSFIYRILQSARANFYSETVSFDYLQTFLSASEDGNVEMFDIFPMEASCRSRHRLKPTSTTKLSHLTITALAINTQETLLAFAEGTDAVLLSGLPMEMPVA
eukprot:m.84423 g.84423  ORF g.84423 m.84423 type:complete len:148 (+) comp14387_c0_seq5:140-583(+)